CQAVTRLAAHQRPRCSLLLHDEGHLRNRSRDLPRDCRSSQAGGGGRPSPGPLPDAAGRRREWGAAFAVAPEPSTEPLYLVLGCATRAHTDRGSAGEDVGGGCGRCGRAERAALPGGCRGRSPCLVRGGRVDVAPLVTVPLPGPKLL